MRLARRFVADVLSVVGRRYPFYLALTVVTGLLEAASLVSAVPLLGAVGVGAAAGATAPSRALMAVLAALGATPAPVTLAAVTGLLLTVSTILFLAQAYVGAALQTQYVFRWQERLVARLFGARWEYLAGRRQGELINAVITETHRLGGAFYQAGLLVTGIVHAIVYLAAAAALSGAVTALVLAAGALLFLLTRPLIRRAYQVGVGIARENATLQSLAGELIGGAKQVKATATEGEAVQLLTATAGRLRRHLLANAFDVQVVRATFESGAALLIAVVLVVSQTAIRSDAAVTLVVLAIFVRLMPKLAGVQHALQSLSLSLPALDAVSALAEEAGRHAERADAGELPGALQTGPFGVAARDVSVHYGAVAAVAGTSLDVIPGSCVALVGGSGAGKSSLVDAMLGLAPLSGGEIRINGRPLAELPLAALRRRIGYMGQESLLYNASIRDNVMWGRTDAAGFETALRLAGADGFVGALPRGADTPVGDRGTLLSGGERQRLCLARAALGRPGLLILDEATSALDAETERAVTDAVAALKGTTTVVMIAHRLSSARIADTIAVMEQGRIVEQGSWDELMRRRGRLHALWQLQHADERAVNAEA